MASVHNILEIRPYGLHFCERKCDIDIAEQTQHTQYFPVVLNHCTASHKTIMLVFISNSCYFFEEKKT